MRVKERAASYLAKSQRHTYQDYLNLPNDGKRYELINGEFVKVAAPFTIHQILSGNIEEEIRAFLKQTQMGIMIHSPIDVVLSETNVVQPDIIFISDDNSNIIEEKNIKGTPDLVIEILSPSTAYYDMIEKKEIYEQFGVKEYWIVDPKKQRVEIFELKGNFFELNQRLNSQGTAKSLILQGFEISLENIFFFIV
ncbi:Uma2 family endonuclease [candidate division KSB1 bacterium]|nr:Uma2 family endonuclease [candidate division KSB1 bacterium]MBL7094331.1 Uma2 family endonuclease [candidate division KSB1 bacterium]